MSSLQRAVTTTTTAASSRAYNDASNGDTGTIEDRHHELSSGNNFNYNKKKMTWMNDGKRRKRKGISTSRDKDVVQRKVRAASDWIEDGHSVGLFEYDTEPLLIPATNMEHMQSDLLQYLV